MPRLSSSRAFSLAVAIAVMLMAAPAHSLQVTGISAVNKRGQTFITWNNLPGTGWTYHVYTAIGSVTNATDFFTYAFELGSVGDSSAVDRRISSLLGTTETFHTDSGGPALSLIKGLFVTTPIESGIRRYIVLAESADFPIDYSFFPGQNITPSPVWEIFATPRPVWQRHIAAPPCDDYVLFSSSSDVPGMPATWQSDGHARHFGVIRGAPGGALILHGHGLGGSFFNSMVGTGRPDENVIAPDDYLPSWDRSSFYLGYNSNYDPEAGKNGPVTGGWVVDYTDRFVLYLIDWAQANLGNDPERVYAMGSSMGGSFAFFLAWHHPERVAAALASIPKTCTSYLGDTDSILTKTFERVWSPISVNLRTTTDGDVPVYNWMDGRDLAQRFQARGSSPVFGFVGRNDHEVGWQEKVPLFQALNEYRAGETWFWDGRGHTDDQTQATWAPEQFDWARLYRFRLDRSYPALSNCSANGNPGDGTSTTGDAVGTINGFVSWDEVPVDVRDHWECVLRPQTLSTLNGTLSPPAGITVDVTPRRLQHFIVSDRTGYRYTVTDAVTGDLLQSGTLEADSLYLLTVPAVPVVANGSRVAIEPTTLLAVDGAHAPRVPRIALAANPVRGATTLHVDWPGDGPARVDLYDLSGRRARSLFAAPAIGGATIGFDTAGLAPGVYLLDARQGAMHASRRVVVIH